MQNEIQNNFNNNINQNAEIEVNNDNKINNNIQQQPKKKNRTLQYYKFLFYSIKAEVKLFEFFNIVSWTNSIEIFLFVIGLVLFICYDTKSAFAIINLLHVARSIFGILIVQAMPKSYEIMEKLEISSEEMESDNFNDIMRKQMRVHFFDKVKQSTTIITVYFSLTIVNMFIDIIDFFNSLANVNEDDENKRLNAYSRLIISSIFLLVDLAYFVWLDLLKYSFPRYLYSVSSLFEGGYIKLSSKLKIYSDKAKVIYSKTIKKQSNNNNNAREINNNKVDNHVKEEKLDI